MRVSATLDGGLATSVQDRARGGSVRETPNQGVDFDAAITCVQVVPTLLMTQSVHVNR